MMKTLILKSSISHSLRCLGAALALAVLPRLAPAQNLSLDPSPAITVRDRGIVLIHDIAETPTNQLLVSGGFQFVDGSPWQTLARLDPDGALYPAFLAPVTNGTLTKHFVTADGSIIIAGFFSEVAAQPRPGLARLFAAGPLDSSWVPAAPGLSQIMSLVPLPDGGFFVAGFGFDPVTFQVEAQARRYTADGQHLDGFPFLRAGGFPDTWSAGPSGELVVTTMDPNFGVRNLVRVFDANGNLDTSFHDALPPTFQPFDAVFDSSGALIVTGQTFPGTGPCLVRISSDRTLDAGFSGVTPLAVWGGQNVIRLAGGGYVILGLFGPGQTLPTLAHFSASGEFQKFLHVTNEPATYPINLVIEPLPSGDYVVHGSMQMVDGVPAPTIARIGPDGTVRDFLADVANLGQVRALIPFAGDEHLFAGAFTSVSGDATSGLATLTASDALRVDLPLIPFGVSSAISTSDGGAIILGGFEPLGGTSTTGLARIRADGAVDPTFLLGPSRFGFASAAELPDGAIILGGTFGAFDPAPDARHLMRVLPGGLLDTTFPDPALTGSGFADVQVVSADSSGRIVFVGRFNSVQGQSRPGIARLLSSGLVDPAFAPDVGLANDATPRLLTALPDGRVYVIGRPANSPDFATKLIRFLADGRLDETFVPAVDPITVSTYLVQPDGTLLVAAADPQGMATSRVVRLLEDGSLDPAFESDVTTNGNVSALHLDSQGRLWIAGSFTQVSGQPREGVARFSPPALPSLQVKIAGPAEVEVPFLGSVLLTAEVTGAAGPLRYEWRHDGRIIRNAREATLRLHHVNAQDAGLYTVTVKDGDASATSAPVEVFVGKKPRPLALLARLLRLLFGL